MSTPEQPESRASATATEAIERVFGADNRARLLTRYFDANGAVTPENAWHHVYRLLLWIDRTTALTHCYESDKAQPGRPWYERSLAFHDWLATALDLAPADLGNDIDWLFREAIGDLTSQAVASRNVAYEKQRAPYAGRGFPEPGEDPELVGITNEFDAARLKAACERRRQNALLFTHVVHINPQGMLAAYGASGRGAAKQIRTHVESGRLMDLATWLALVISI